jgi:hypothetical protein
MKERRHSNDRRAYLMAREKSRGNNRRRHPDRRLNNIMVEWIPMGLAHSHPVTRHMFELTRRVFKAS